MLEFIKENFWIILFILLMATYSRKCATLLTLEIILFEPYGLVGKLSFVLVFLLSLFALNDYPSHRNTNTPSPSSTEPKKNMPPNHDPDMD